MENLKIDLLSNIQENMFEVKTTTKKLITLNDAIMEEIEDIRRKLEMINNKAISETLNLETITNLNDMMNDYLITQMGKIQEVKNFIN